MKKEVLYKGQEVLNCPMVKIGKLNIDYCVDKCDYHSSKIDGKIKCNYWAEV